MRSRKGRRDFGLRVSRGGGCGAEGSQHWEQVANSERNGAETRAHSTAFIIGVDLTWKVFSYDCSRCRNKPLQLDQGLERLYREDDKIRRAVSCQIRLNLALLGLKLWQISAHPTYFVLYSKTYSLLLLCFFATELLTFRKQPAVAKLLLPQLPTYYPFFKSSGI